MLIVFFSFLQDGSPNQEIPLEDQVYSLITIAIVRPVGSTGPIVVDSIVVSACGKLILLIFVINVFNCSNFTSDIELLNGECWARGENVRNTFLRNY